VKHLFGTDAYEKIYRWRKGLNEGTNDEIFREYVLMKEMGWSWNELMDTPEEIYLSLLRIISIKAKDEIKRSKEATKHAG